MRTAGFLLSSSALAEHLAADGPERESSSGQGCTYRIVGCTSELSSSAQSTQMGSDLELGPSEVCLELVNVFREEPPHEPRQRRAVKLNSFKLTSVSRGWMRERWRSVSVWKLRY
ncbi:unnamed protein product [Leuciscus chuanchicus]